jgi:hypothetical protein
MARSAVYKGVMNNTTPKLTWVHAHLEKNGETVYVGRFEDGTMRVIRRSFRSYVSVAQLERYSLSRGELIFSSKPSVPLGKAQRPRLICEIKIELRPEKALAEEPAMIKNPADQFSDDEMAQVKRFGAALGGKPTDFDEEVEMHLARHEANSPR